MLRQLGRQPLCRAAAPTRHAGTALIRHCIPGPADVGSRADTPDGSPATSAAPTGPTSQPDDFDPSAIVNKISWDPEGLLPPAPEGLGGHFERRAAMRAATAAAAASLEAQRVATATLGGFNGAPDGVLVAPSMAAIEAQADLGLPAMSAHAGQTTNEADFGHLGMSGVAISKMTSNDRTALAAKLSTHYMTVNLDYPGLRLRHLEPPIFTIDHFMTHTECKEMAEAAQATGRMQASRIGWVNADSNGAGAYSGARRTSTSMLLAPMVLAQHPALASSVTCLHERAQNLLPIDTTAHHQPAWATPGRLPKPGQRCFESPQVARYEAGQHFLQHEDAFPLAISQHQQFQRHATLLVYLNDVPQSCCILAQLNCLDLYQGGCTHFTHLDLSIQPVAGTALLFFPAFADGTADARTLHSAEDAYDPKIVFQQWIACGVSTPLRPSTSRSNVEVFPQPQPPLVLATTVPVASSHGGEAVVAEVARSGANEAEKGSRGKKKTARGGKATGKGFGR